MAKKILSVRHDRKPRQIDASMICFTDGEGPADNDAIRIKEDGGWIEISAAHGRLEIQPQGANIIRVRPTLAN